MITMVKIDNVFSTETGERKKAKLAEATKNNYHNLEFMLCPMGGSFDLMVQSDYEFQYESGRPMTQEDAETELKSLMVFILMDLI